MLDRLRQKLTIIGELTIDESGGEHDVANLEHNLVLARADSQLSLGHRLSDARQLLQRAGRDICLDSALKRSASVACLTLKR